MGRHKKVIERLPKQQDSTAEPFADEGSSLPAIHEVSPIEEITRAEIDTQIATAKKYPRSVRRFRQEALTMATFDVGIAGQCFYVLERAGKRIEGPSVRLAEICANAWGNMRYGARIVGEDKKCVVAQGISHDLEKNVSDTIEVSRRITDRNGHTFSDDMIQVTKNAACSIALRNAIFKTIPFAYVKPIYEQAKKVAVGGIKTLNTRKTDMVKAFDSLKINVKMLEKFLDKSLEDAGLADVETLIGAYNAIKEGDTTVAEQFNIRSKGEVQMPKKKSEAIQEEIPEIPIMLTYKEENHEYRYNKIIVPGVNKILQMSGIISFDHIPIDRREAGMHFGKVVHSACQLYDEGKLDIDNLIEADEDCDQKVCPYLNGWIKFKHDYKIVILSNEKKLYSKKYNFAGRHDRVVLLTGTTMLDIKTYIDSKTGTGLQLAGYSILWDENHPEHKIHNRMAVRLLPDDYRISLYKNRSNKYDFLVCLQMHNLKTKRGLL